MSAGLYVDRPTAHEHLEHPTAAAVIAIARRADAAGFERVMIGGGGWTVGLMSALLAHPVVLDGRSHLGVEQPRIVVDVGGRIVTVYRAAPWFGENDAGADKLHTAWRGLRRLLEREKWPLLASPAATGATALRMSWSRLERTYPPMPMRLQELFRAHTGQGRFEVFPGALTPGPELFRYDVRFAYGALASLELPVGEPVYREGAAAHEHWRDNRYAPGLYRVSFRVPPSWRHVGLLRVGDAYPHNGNGGPRASGLLTTWAEGAEVFLAHRYGWRPVVVESYTFAARARPLAAWIKRIQGLRERSSDPLVRAGLRAMALHAIGLLHGTARRTERTAATAPDETDPSVHNPWFDSRARCWRYTQLEQPMASLAHPEWTAAIWARQRVRLLDDRGAAGLLHIPYGELVGCALDAVFTSTEQRDWADPGADGWFRLTGRWAPRPAIAALPELYAAQGGDRA